MKLQKNPLIIMILTLMLFSCKKEDTEMPSGEKPIENVPVVPVTTEKGKPLGELVRRTIGTSGGAVSSDDKSLTLTVPAGALSKNAEISIQRISNESPNGLNEGYRIATTNNDFSKKLSLCWSYTRQNIRGTKIKNLALAYQGADRSWNATKDIHIDEKDSTICFNNIEDLKNQDWSFVSSLCIQSGNIESVILRGVENFMITGISIGNKYWNPLPKERVYYSPDIVATTVNGVDFGNNQYGTFSEEGYVEGDFSARYIAPTYKVPTNNPVELKAIIQTAPDLLEEVTTFVELRRGNNSLSIAAEGSANLPSSFAIWYQDKHLSLTVWDDDYVSPKIVTSATFEVQNFKPQVGTYHSGENLDVSAWRTGGQVWRNFHMVDPPVGNRVKKYAEGTLTVSSITNVIGEVNSGRQGAIMKGSYNFTCFIPKPGGKDLEYLRSGVTGTFETFIYL